MSFRPTSHVPQTVGTRPRSLNDVLRAGRSAIGANGDGFAIKTSGTNAATEEERAAFNENCPPEARMDVIVDDDEHAMLSPDYQLEFTYNHQRFQSVQEAFDALYDGGEPEPLFASITMAKFEEHPDAKELLMSTGEKPLIHYDTQEDSEWGMNMETITPENFVNRFVLGNLAGRLLMGARNIFATELGTQ